MIEKIIIQGVELLPELIPGEWDERMTVRFNSGPVTLTFKDGTVSIAPGEDPDAESIIQLTNKRFCDAVDGTIDFMTIWREIAEPSPTDRRFILKGSGAKLITIMDILCRCYSSDAAFKKSLDDYKKSLS